MAFMKGQREWIGRNMRMGAIGDSDLGRGNSRRSGAGR